MVGNLTILYTLVLPQGNRIPLQPNNYYDRPAIETTERYVKMIIYDIFYILVHNIYIFSTLVWWLL